MHQLWWSTDLWWCINRTATGEEPGWPKIIPLDDSSGQYSSAYVQEVTGPEHLWYQQQQWLRSGELSSLCAPTSYILHLGEWVLSPIRFVLCVFATESQSLFFIKYFRSMEDTRTSKWTCQNGTLMGIVAQTGGFHLSLAFDALVANSRTFLPLLRILLNPTPGTLMDFNPTSASRMSQPSSQSMRPAQCFAHPSHTFFVLSYIFSITMSIMCLPVTSILFFTSVLKLLQSSGLLFTLLLTNWIPLADTMTWTLIRLKSQNACCLRQTLTGFNFIEGTYLVFCFHIILTLNLYRTLPQHLGTPHKLTFTTCSAQ